jgi:tetratricopeptide (TPR) repeat protein
MNGMASLVQTLLELYSSRSSGVFRIERQTAKKQLVLKDGLLVYAESNLPQEHLARIMIVMSLLPKDKMKDISVLMKTRKTSEEAIFEACHPDAQSLLKGRHEQAIVITASLLGWDEFAMHFYPGENLVRFQLNLGLALPDLLSISARRAVKDHRGPFSSTQLEETFVLCESFSRKEMPFPLSKEEYYVCSLLNEKIKAADLISVIPAGEAAPEELLRRLMILGLIKLEAKASSASESYSLVLEIEDMLLRFETASPYEILSVKTDANQAELQAAYHELAKRVHPDRFQSRDFSAQDREKAQRVFTLINTAYTTLRDPASRTSYDETRLAKESKVEAVLKAKAAKSEEETQVEALFQEGRLSLIRGNFEKAVDQLKSCVWLNPKKANYNYYLGLAESEIPTLLKSAEQHFLKAIELENMFAGSHLSLAKLYIKVMLPRKAEMQLQELLRWDPRNLEAQTMLAELEKAEKTRTGALRWKR